MAPVLLKQHTMSGDEMNFDIHRLNDTTILSFYGELTIQYANEIRLALAESIKSSDNLVVDLGSVTAIDLSCLQLLCAAHLSSLRSNKQFSLDVRCNEILYKILDGAGFMEHRVCSFDPGVSCPWNG